MKSNVLRDNFKELFFLFRTGLKARLYLITQIFVLPQFDLAHQEEHYLALGIVSIFIKSLKMAFTIIQTRPANPVVCSRNK